MQVRFEIDPLSPQAKSFMMEIVEDFLANHEEEGVNFTESVRDWYENLMDDLYDSVGEPDHQKGVLERMSFVEQYLGKFLDGTYSPALKRTQAKGV